MFFILLQDVIFILIVGVIFKMVLLKVYQSVYIVLIRIQDKYRLVLKNFKNIVFDLKVNFRKVISDVCVSIGDNLVLIVEVVNVSDIECKRIYQLYINMLLSLNKYKIFFGLLI